MKAISKITFLDDHGEKFFGEGPAQLLLGLEKSGSLRAAAQAMDMAYTKALKLVNHAETVLGFPLISRTTGGKSGGGSVLTSEGKKWLTRYEAYRDACIRENQRLYREHFPKTGCIIMASGMGLRFGGNKLMADFGGKPLFLRAIEATQALFDSRVVVTRHAEVAQICQELGIHVVLHDLPHRSDTIRLGLEALGDADCCLFCPADQPLLRRETVAGLIESWMQQRGKIWRPACEDMPGGPALFPAWTFAELSSLPQDKGGSTLMLRYPESVCYMNVSDPKELTDVDTPQALEELKKYLT